MQDYINMYNTLNFKILYYFVGSWMAMSNVHQNNPARTKSKSVSLQSVEVGHYSEEERVLP